VPERGSTKWKNKTSDRKTSLWSCARKDSQIQKTGKGDLIFQLHDRTGWAVKISLSEIGLEKIFLHGSFRSADRVEGGPKDNRLLSRFFARWQLVVTLQRLIKSV